MFYENEKFYYDKIYDEVDYNEEEYVDIVYKDSGVFYLEIK